MRRASRLTLVLLLGSMGCSTTYTGPRTWEGDEVAALAGARVVCPGAEWTWVEAAWKVRAPGAGPAVPGPLRLAPPEGAPIVASSSVVSGWLGSFQGVSTDVNVAVARGPGPFEVLDASGEPPAYLRVAPAELRSLLRADVPAGPAPGAPPLEVARATLEGPGWHRLEIAARPHHQLTLRVVFPGEVVPPPDPATEATLAGEGAAGVTDTPVRDLVELGPGTHEVVLLAGPGAPGGPAEVSVIRAAPAAAKAP